MSATRNSRLLGMLLLIAVFVAGGAVGVVLDRYIHVGREPSMRTFVSADMSGVLDRLGLTGEQRAQARAIIERSAPRTEQTMLDVADHLRVISDSVDSELRAILTPAQRMRLDSLRITPKLLLKRKLVTPAGTKMDTLFLRP